MYFPKFQKRFKRQEEFVANHAQTTGMVRLKTAPNQTGNAIEVNAAIGNNFVLDALGNLTCLTVSSAGIKLNNNGTIIGMTDIAAAATIRASFGVAVSTPFASSGGVDKPLFITPTYTQTSTAGSADLFINRTETSIGSGAQLLMDAQVGSVSKFKVDRLGTVTSVNLTSGLVTCDNVKNTVTVYSGGGSSISMGACTGLMTITNTSAQAFTTTSPSSVPSNTIFALKNLSAFTQTFTASSSSLDGVGSGTKAIAAMATFYFYTDGSNWFSA